MVQPSKKSISQLRTEIKGNPNVEVIFELAEQLIGTPEARIEARELCFRGLSDNPKHLKGRLLLARLFYEDGYGEFCVRELLELKRLAPVASLNRLIEAFGDFARPFFYREIAEDYAAQGGRAAEDVRKEGSVVAEVDLEADFLDVLDELDKLDK